MGHSTCCVVTCKNTGKNSACKFYAFPTSKWKLEQRKKWIAAVNRTNADGSPWHPKPHDKICSAHFIGGKKSEAEANPSYVPTIFPPTYRRKKIEHPQMAVRENSFKIKVYTDQHIKDRAQVTVGENSSMIQGYSEQKLIDQSQIIVTDNNIIMTQVYPDKNPFDHSEITITDNNNITQEYLKQELIDNSQVVRDNSSMIQEYPDQQLVIKTEPIEETVSEANEWPVTLMADKGCQVDISNQLDIKETTFICNRYIQNSSCDAEIQVEIANTSRIGTINCTKTKDKYCRTNEVTNSDQSTSTTCKDFAGISSVKNDQQLQDIAGVSYKNFDFLLKKMSKEKSTVSKKDRLFIFLMKFKTGLTFSALSLLFGIHRTTISRIFYHTLQDLVFATADLVFWPDKAVVQAIMPDCYRPVYSNTRVIIDCTEFSIDVPLAVDDRVASYSHCDKKGFTAKVLIGITPGGFICFKSKVAGGGKSDSEMTIESGLVDKLESGDLVLANKSLTEIKKVIDTSGKEIRVVMLPFLENINELDVGETNQTCDIAKVRIDKEKIMQRLRVYRILDKIPCNLYDCIDDIVHVCCVLVNLQSSILHELNSSE